MKKFKSALATCCCAVFLLSVPVFAAETNAREITVNAKGTVYAEPDTAEIVLGVRTVADTSLKAQSENAEIMENVTSALKELGFTENQFRTSDFSIYPDYSNSSSQTITGYTATNTITVTTKDLDNITNVIDAAAKAGANINNGVYFSVENPSQYYGKALELAVANAKTSAEYIAGALNVTIGAPVSVTENGGGYSYETASSKSMAANADMDGGSGASTEIYYDDIEITARLTVVYNY